jgi:thioredoxin 1|tara:strand:+ start:230 stop:487 length:258 start_codon:yes stop_codon:yes gene_type:complete
MVEVKFFNAAWCGPCKQMKPHIDKLQKEGYNIQEIDIDQNSTLAESAEIRGVPTLAIYENGNEVERLVGYEDYDRLKARIDIFKK